MTAGATVVLVLITRAYARESKRMADEMVEGRRAAREDARLAEERARRSVAERLVNMLHGTQVLCMVLPNSEVKSANAISGMRALFRLWEPFDAMGPDFHLLQDPDLQRDLYIFHAEVRMLAQDYIESLARVDVANRDLDSGAEGAKRRYEAETAVALRVRQTAKDAGNGYANRAAELVRRLQALVPGLATPAKMA